MVVIEIWTQPDFLCEFVPLLNVNLRDLPRKCCILEKETIEGIVVVGVDRSAERSGAIIVSRKPNTFVQCI